MSLKDEHGSGAGGRGGNGKVQGDNSAAKGGDGGEGVIGPGGPGGDADVQGNNSRGVGGPGGRGGLGGGGRGGDAAVRGDNITSAGGEGGEANQPDGRGGRGGKSGYFTLGLPDYQLPDGRWISEFGGGGTGGHSPQYAARLMVIEDILGCRITMHATSAGIQDAETGNAILGQLNQRLGRDLRPWRVRIAAGCFEFYDL